MLNFLLLAACADVSVPMNGSDNGFAGTTIDAPTGTADWHVDQAGGSDFESIQEAIDAALPGDWILVAPGTYAERINYNGKSLWISSRDGSAATTIDAKRGGTGVTVVGGETSRTALVGFTIENAVDYGVQVDFSSIHLEDVRITGASGAYAIHGGSSDVELQDVTIDNNDASYAAIYMSRGSLQMTGSSVECGGGYAIYSGHGYMQVDQSTITCSGRNSYAIAVEHTVGTVLRSTLTATQLQQVVMNLTTNAAESLGERAGRVIVQTSFAALQPDEAAALNLAPGAYVVLSVQDDGCGMSAAVKKRIFDPFFTTKAHGRGLGLAAVHGIVRVHRGAVHVRSKEQIGTVVSVYLPATSVRPTPRPQRTNTLRSGSGLLLVIDDEAEVRATARAMLEALGYDVIAAEEGRSGLLLFDRHRKDIRAVLLDMTMPVMSGEEVYRELRLRDKGVRIVLSTGYSQVDARRRGMLDGIRGFLQKPYTVRQLSETVGRALEDGATGLE